MKVDLVKREGVGQDLRPHLDLWIDAKPWMTVFMNGDGRDHLPVIAGALAFCRCDLAVMVTEGYAVVESTLERETLRRGELAERFAAGDRRVREGLMVAMFPRDEPAVMWSVSYRYDGRRVVWEDERCSDPGATGLLPDVARDAYAHRVAEAGLMDHAELAGNLIALPGVDAVGLFVEKTPPRNVPCPCGSGRKTKHCDHGAN
jgi:hypothetical protein